MQRPSVVFEMPDLTKPDEVVSEAEMEFFCEYGFLVKKALLDPDKLELCARPDMGAFTRQGASETRFHMVAVSRRQTDVERSRVGRDVPSPS